MNRKGSKLTAFLLTLAMIFANLGFGSVSEVSATETDGTTAENITVTMNFDCSSLGTEEAMASLGFETKMESLKLKLPAGATVYDAVLEAEKVTEGEIKANTNSKYISSAYGLGDGLNGVKDLFGWDGSDVPLPSSPFNYNWAGWNFSVDGEQSQIGAAQSVLKKDCTVDFRYMLAWKDGGAYDWDFVDAYNDVEKYITKAENVDRSGYDENQMNYLDKFLEEAKAVKNNIDNESCGLWANYFAEQGTLLYGPGSPTDSLKRSAENLQKAIDKKCFEIIGVKASCGDVYVGEKTKIKVEVLPVGAPQECIYDVLFGDVTVSEDGYIIGEKEGTAMIQVKSKENPGKTENLKVSVKSAPLYKITFTSKEADIKAGDVTLKDASDSVIKPEGEVFALTKGKYTYEINVKGKDKRNGILVVNDETFTINTDRAEEVVISYDTFAEEKAYKETAGYLQKNLAPDYNDWVVMGLARSGKLTEKQAKDYYKKTADYIKSLENDRPYATDYARCIIGLTAAGWDITNVDGKNLLSYLSDYDFVVKNGINGVVYTLIALDTHDYEITGVGAGKTQITRDSLIKYILDKQKTDGVWNWDDNAAEADIDMTAMALQALAPYYKDNNDVKAACDKAVKVLSEKQEIDGTYISWEMKSASTSAEVITALTALGIDPDNDARFVKNGNSVIDGLNSLAAKGGGYIYDSDAANEFSSRSGYYAMVSYYRFAAGKNSLYDMTDVTIEHSSDNGSGNGTVSGSESINQGNAGEVETGDGFPLKTVILILLVALVGTIAGLSTSKKK